MAEGEVSVFYRDNRMVASTNLGLIQTAFDMLTGHFDHLGLKKNDKKLWGLYATHSRPPGEGQNKPIPCTWSYNERQHERVNFLKCGADLTRWSLTVHFQTHHGVAKGGSV